MIYEVCGNESGFGCCHAEMKYLSVLSGNDRDDDVSRIWSVKDFVVVPVLGIQGTETSLKRIEIVHVIALRE